MPTTYGNDIVYCLKSHCGVRGYCRQKWVLQVQIICKFSNERTCKRNKDVQGLSCGFEVNINTRLQNYNPIIVYRFANVAIEICFSTKLEAHELRPYTSSKLSSLSSAKNEKQSLVVGSYKYSILVAS